MKHVAFLAGTALFSLLGAFILVMDVIHGGQLHVVSASIGAGFLVGAVAVAIPLRIRVALENLAPLKAFLPWAKGG